MTTDVTTHLFYGLFVTTSSLYIASEAFKKVQGPLLAIQLIQLRQSSSTLQITAYQDSSKSITTTLPAEIWNMIKIELIKVELAQSEKDLLRECLCEHCNGICDSLCGCDDDEDSESHHTAQSWKEFPSKFCDACDTKFIETGPWIRDLAQLQGLDKILSYYHLEIIPINVDEGGRWDFDPLSAIGIIKQQQECHSFAEYSPYHAISTLSPSTFDLPYSVDYISRQFKALLKDYGVEIGDPKGKTIRSQPVAKEDETSRKKSALQGDMTEPKWHLWTRGMYDY